MSSLRRLAKDHATLRTAPPPNYILPSDDEFEASADDLTQLPIYLTGSEGTPYCHGLWLLHLRMPPDYPKSPPKATFRTRIFHPNVDETTGAVCLETLKRDWDPKLTLKDILITISCLLIQPNPDSALNEKAGVLVREDFDGFTKQAKLMTKIHAPIPAELKTAVEEARRRGEDDSKCPSKVRNSMHTPTQDRPTMVRPIMTENNSSESLDSTKENKPSQREHMKRAEPIVTIKNILGKRSLAASAQPTESEDLNPSANVLLPTQSTSQSEDGERPRKSPKHTHSRQSDNRQAESDTQDCINTQQAILEIHRTVKLGHSKTSVHTTTRKMPAQAEKYRSHARIGIKRL